MSLVTKIWKHFCLVNKHRWYVFKLSIKAGIPWRGFLHDLSKYSWTEFSESVKYYNGEKSPIYLCRQDKGYSLSWIHHKGRNKHHFEYWEDLDLKHRFPVFLPYKYIVEAVCDKIAAGMVYEGEKWDQTEPLRYWNNIEKENVVLKHPASIAFMDIVLKKIADEGVNSGLKPKFLKSVYKKVSEEFM